MARSGIRVPQAIRAVCAQITINTYGHLFPNVRERIRVALEDTGARVTDLLDDCSRGLGLPGGLAALTRKVPLTCGFEGGP